MRISDWSSDVCSSDLIDYLGRLDDVRPAIAACSVYVLPSYREGTPRTVLEAMAMGRAIITTDAPGCRQTVEEGRNGYLVPPRRSEEHTSELQSLMRISYAVFCLKKNTTQYTQHTTATRQKFSL